MPPRGMLLFASSSLRVPARGGAGDADQATEGAAGLPARVHSRARLRAHARRDRAALRARLAGDRAQAPDQPRAEGTHPAAREPQPCARADRGTGCQRRGRRPAPRARGGGGADRGGRGAGDRDPPRGAARPRRDLRAARAWRLDDRRGNPRRRPDRGRVAARRGERRHRGRAGARRGDGEEALSRARARPPRARQREARSDRRAPRRRRDPRRGDRRAATLPLGAMSPSLLLLDVDNTLYPPSRGVVGRVDALINRYLVERVGIDAAEVDGIRRRLWSDYGTTLHGLMHRRGIDPADYLRFVHAIELGELLAADPALAVMLGRIPLLKVAVTNGSEAHARGVLDCLGVRPLFFRVYGLERLAFVPKPYVQAYQIVLADLHALGRDCILVEDRAVNLRTARQLGMRTVYIADGGPPAPEADVSIGSVLDLEQALATLA